MDAARQDQQVSNRNHGQGHRRARRALAIRRADLRAIQIQVQVLVFQIHHLRPRNAASASNTATPDPSKTEAEIQAEIAALFRQITASVTFLPQLSGDCTFNVLVYADADSDVPVEWGDSDAKEIVNGERVQLRGFSTTSHRVETLVSYRLGE